MLLLWVETTMAQCHSQRTVTKLREWSWTQATEGSVLPTRHPREDWILTLGLVWVGLW